VMPVKHAAHRYHKRQHLQQRRQQWRLVAYAKTVPSYSLQEWTSAAAHIAYLPSFIVSVAELVADTIGSAARKLLSLGSVSRSGRILNLRPLVPNEESMANTA
jgi:hypothetical protein